MTETESPLSAGPLSAEDRLEMIELVSRYNHAIDGRDAVGWADTFTRDGTFVIEGVQEFHGRDELIGMVEAMPPAGHRHWTSNFVIEGEGDRATMDLDLTLLDGPKVVSTGRYLNDLVRVDGRWLFERRRYLPD